MLILHISTSIYITFCLLGTQAESVHNVTAAGKSPLYRRAVICTRLTHPLFMYYPLHLLLQFVDIISVKKIVLIY